MFKKRRKEEMERSFKVGECVRLVSEGGDFPLHGFSDGEMYKIAEINPKENNGIYKYKIIREDHRPGYCNAEHLTPFEFKVGDQARVVGCEEEDVGLHNGDIVEIQESSFTRDERVVDNGGHVCVTNVANNEKRVCNASSLAPVDASPTFVEVRNGIDMITAFARSFKYDSQIRDQLAGDIEGSEGCTDARRLMAKLLEMSDFSVNRTFGIEERKWTDRMTAAEQEEFEKRLAVPARFNRVEAAKPCLPNEQKINSRCVDYKDECHDKPCDICYDDRIKRKNQCGVIEIKCSCGREFTVGGQE